MPQQGQRLPQGMPQQGQRLPQGMPQQGQRLPQGMPQQAQLGRAQGGMIQGIQGLQRSPMGMPRNQQPAGILNSSPQLMNAARGFKDGGQVVKAKDGMFYDKNNLSFFDRLIQGQGVIRAREAENEENKAITKINDGSNAGAVSLDSLITKNNNARAIGASLNAEANAGGGVDGPAVTVASPINEFDLSGDTSATNDNMQPGVTNNQGLGENEGPPGEIINSKLKDGLATQTKETDVLVPKTSDIQKKATASLEAWKKKLIKTDKTYEVSEKKSQTMLAEVKKVLAETDEEIDLDGIERMAKKTLGLKEGKEYDEDRLTSFWMSMIKGGLATAAGESSNALTNIAKGLGFGVEAYGKDLNAINEDEREDRKALAKMKYDLVKDEKTARIAKRTLKLQGYTTLATMEQNQNQFESKEAYQKERDMIKDQMAFANLDLVAYQTFNKIGMDGATHDLRIAAFALDKQKQKDFVKANNDKLNQDYKLGIMTKEMKNVYSLGDSYVEFDEKTETFSYTELGEAALLASVASKTSLTDLKTSAIKISSFGNIEGFKYGSPDKTEKAFYYYEKVTKPQLAALVKEEKGTLGLKPGVIKARKQEIMADFGKNTGALNSVGTSPANSQLIEGKKYTDKNGITKTYRNGKFE